VFVVDVVVEVVVGEVSVAVVFKLCGVDSAAALANQKRVSTAATSAAVRIMPVALGEKERERERERKREKERERERER
jgi:ribosomal protein L12E/L44/L45/RPP1/RPP2